VSLAHGLGPIQVAVDVDEGHGDAPRDGVPTEIGGSRDVTRRQEVRSRKARP
jgi:hypothetical protein